MDQPLVTIAIPTYNRADSYLPLTLGSALSQTYGNIEIIVADNGSTDHTEALVRECRDPRVRYFRHTRNLVPNDNFNFCLAQARGEYFQLLLDDEQIDPDFVEVGLNRVPPGVEAGLIRTGLRTVDANGSVIEESPNRAEGLSLPDLLLAWFDGRTRIYLCNTLFNRRLLLTAGGFHSRHNLFQDVGAQVRVAARSRRVDIAPVKASTRRHPGQFTHAARVQEWCEDSLELLELMCDLCPERRDEIREAGLRFFNMIAYRRASVVRSPLARARTFSAVYRAFSGRHLPPARLVLASTGLYRSMRNLKRRIRGQPAWAAD